MLLKTCLGCNLEKEANTVHFHKHSSARDGLNPRCKACVKVADATYKRKYRKCERPGFAICRKCDQELPLDSFGSNPSWCKACDSAYELVRRNGKYKTDEKFRAVILMRHTAMQFFKTAIFDRHLGRSSKKVHKTIGCTKEQFLNHIESLFQPGMKWQNYGKGKGKWEFDHVYPLVKAYDQGPDFFKNAGLYTNIAPKWFEDNASKGSRVSKEQEDTEFFLENE